VRTRFHRFLLIVMMLVLPLQAFAAAAMIGCSMTQHAATPIQAGDTAMSGCHESAPQPDSPASQHSCAHCAACYLTSVPLLPALTTLSGLPAVSNLIPHAATSFSGHIPEGPERPPRAHSA
jgi:hypothetical protein